MNEHYGDTNTSDRKQRRYEVAVLTVFSFAVTALLLAASSPKTVASILDGFMFGLRIERHMDRQEEEFYDLETMIEAEELKSAAPADNPYNKVGVYLTASSTANDEFLEKTFAALEEAGGNAFVIDVKGSMVYFPTTSALADSLNQVKPLYELPEIVAKAKERNLYVIARYIALKDPLIAQKLPEAQLKHPQTNRSLHHTWVDGSHPTILEYNYQILRDVAVAGVDEINLDYIRWPTDSIGSTGRNGEEKSVLVTEFVKMARQAIDQHNPEVKLGISTYAILGWNFPINFEPLGQDIRGTGISQYVDVVSPMAYPATFSVGGYYNPAKHRDSRMYWLVYRTLTGYAELLGEDQKHKIRPWIQGYFVSQKNVSDQIRAVYDSGACGFTMWNANNNHGKFYAANPTVEPPTHCI